MFRRFVSLRGYPTKLFSDSGSQLVSASKELNEFIKGLDYNRIKEFGAHNGLQWSFSTSDAPWKNGTAE